MSELVEAAIKTGVTILVSGIIGWAVALFRLDSRIAKALEPLRTEHSDHDAADDAARAAHDALHGRLATEMAKSLADLREVVDDLANRVSDHHDRSVSDFAKEAEVAIALSSTNELCRDLLASVSRLEGRVETMIELAGHGPPTRPRR